MDKVKPKKHLGQHFLNDEYIAKKIVDSLTEHCDVPTVLEIGPGMGVLTKYLIQEEKKQLAVAEIDRESVAYLYAHYPDLRIIQGDFLQENWEELIPESFSIIGNFPYNISSQIFFKVLELKHRVPTVVGMLQKEVAERIASKEGSKKYGILSVFLQAYYEVEYLFTVNADVFIPPPKVQSAVVRLKRNNVTQLLCDEKLFVRVVKQGFNNRRKTLRNALKPLNLPPELLEKEIFNKRAEQLSVDQFVQLTLEIQNI